MDPRFSTLDLTPRTPPTGYRIAVALLGLGLVGAIGAHLQSIGELRREFTVGATEAHACEQQREALLGEVESLRRAPQEKTTDAGARAPAGSSPIALRVGDTAKASVTPKLRSTATRSAARGLAPSEDDVMSLIGGGQPSLQACYQKALRHQPGLGMRSLRLRLSFTVRSSGDVRSVAFKPSPGRELRACLKDVVGAWSVRPFGGDSIAVEVPITLAPQG